MSSADQIARAGRLVAWAARPKERPGRHADYKELCDEYRDNLDGFAETADAVAAGLGLTLTVDEQVGVIAVADSDSPFRVTVADVIKRVGSNERRVLVGLVILAVAKTAFPHPSHLDDPLRVGRVSVASAVEYLNRLVERIEENAPDPEEGDSALTEVWRMWDALRQTRYDAQRFSTTERAGLVRRVCGFLEDEGHLAAVSKDDGGTWRATPRFRLAVKTMAEDTDVYAALIDLIARAETTDSGEADV